MARPTEAVKLEVCNLVYRQMHALTAGCRRDFEDLAQAAAAEALRALPAFRGEAKLSTWTYGVCHRVYLKRRRSLARWMQRFTLTAEGEIASAVSRERSCESTLEERERARALETALARLPVKHQVVVILHDLEELSSDEVAAIVNANVGTVRSRLRDGRRRLRHLLSKHPSFASLVERDGRAP